MCLPWLEIVPAPLPYGIMGSSMALIAHAACCVALRCTVRRRTATWLCAVTTPRLYS